MGSDIEQNGDVQLPVDNKESASGLSQIPVNYSVAGAVREYVPVAYDAPPGHIG